MSETITFVRRPHRLKRILTYAWSVVFALFGALTVRMLATSPTTTVTCDRAAGTCSLDGTDVRIADITAVVLENHHVTKQGDFWYPRVKLRDGSERTLVIDGAQRDDVIDSYRASVDAFRAFLADPSAPTFATTFVYHASIFEKLWTLITFVMGLVVLLGLMSTTVTRTTTIAPGTVTVHDRRMLLPSKTRTIPAAEILSVETGAFLALRLADRTSLQLAADGDAAAADKIAALLDKPVEIRASASGSRSR